MTLEKLKDIIIDFPFRISEVKLTGGEPLLNKELPGMVNWLLDQGIFVTVFSNLTKSEIFLQIKQTYRFRIAASYHSCFDSNKFIKNYDYLKNYHRIDIEEIGKKTLSISKLKKFCTIADTRERMSKYLRIGIDGLIFTSCYDWLDYYTKIEKK